jgi:hypothetical protein
MPVNGSLFLRLQYHPQGSELGLEGLPSQLRLLSHSRSFSEYRRFALGEARHQSRDLEQAHLRQQDLNLVE